MSRPAALFALLVACLGAGCWALESTVPVGVTVPTPRGLLLVNVPSDTAAQLEQAPVVEQFEQAVRLGHLRAPALEPLLRQHMVVTGMSQQEVIWAFRAHPSSVRFSGPPGGRTFHWEPGRYWVRFDETGAAVSAGRY